MLCWHDVSKNGGFHVCTTIWVLWQVNIELVNCSIQIVNVSSLTTSQIIAQLGKMSKLYHCYQTILALFRSSTIFLIIGTVALPRMLSRLTTSSPSTLQSVFISKRHMRCMYVWQFYTGMKMLGDLDSVLKEPQIETKITVTRPVREHVTGQRGRHINFSMK